MTGSGYGLAGQFWLLESALNKVFDYVQWAVNQTQRTNNKRLGTLKNKKYIRVKQKWIKYWISTVCYQAYLISGLSLIFQNLFVSIWSLAGFKFVDLDFQQATLSVSEQIKTNTSVWLCLKVPTKFSLDHGHQAREAKNIQRAYHRA